MLDLSHLPNPIPGERLVHFLRRHYLTLTSLVFGYLVVLIFPFLTWWYLANFQPALLENEIARTFIVLFGSIFFLFVWLFLFQHWMDYHLDLWVVTTKRILNIEQTGLFSRTVSELRLYRIQDVTATVNGVVHTIFDFGNVEIQTAGEKERFRFEEVPHPNAVAKSILEYAELDRREHLDDAVEEFALANKKRQE